MKKCRNCGEIKPDTEFYFCSTHFRLGSYCKLCDVHLSRKRAIQKGVKGQGAVQQARSAESLFTLATWQPKVQGDLQAKFSQLQKKPK